jgi:hypothetical protein
VKKAINLLAQAHDRICEATSENEDCCDCLSEALNLIDDAIAEIRTPASYTISDAVDVLAEARAFLEKEYIDDGIDKISSAISMLGELSEPPRWETPEQHRERTGRDWPENWAVYVLVRNKYVQGRDYSWRAYNYYDTRPFRGRNPIVCATEAGKPPNSWRPEVTQ